MKFSVLIFLILGLAASSSARQVLEIRPRVTDSQLYYEDDNSQLSTVVDEESQKEDAEYIIAHRPSLFRTAAAQSRVGSSKNTLSSSSQKVAPVQTIRNYNKVNDDGSFTFGYEAADGSFKEETRGTDCVVRGKYGYIDPDGNKREFTYVSGNPCDPNAPNGELDDDEDLKNKKLENDDEELDEPANYPSIRPVPVIKSNYPKKSVSTTPASVYHRELAAYLQEESQRQQEYKASEEAQPVLIKPTYRPKPRPNYLQIGAVQGESLYPTSPRPKVSATTQGTTASPVYRITTPSPKYHSLQSTNSIRYLQQYTTPSYQQLEAAKAASRPQLTSATVAITPRPHIAQVAAQYLSPASSDTRAAHSASESVSNTERPGVVYAKQHAQATLIPSSSHLTANVPLEFAAELEEYVNTVPVKNVPVQSLPVQQSYPAQSSAPKSNGPIYQSELIFDPSSGQYKTQLYQTLPQSLGDFRVNHKLQPYVAQQIVNQPQPGLSQAQASIPVRAPPTPRPPQPQEKIYRQQQTEQLIQSQQLFSQQQRRQQIQQSQQAKPSIAAKYQFLPAQKDSQAYYYAVSPSTAPDNARSPDITIGQIDQFLRGSTAGFQ